MKEEILKGLQKSLRDYDAEGCVARAKKAVQEGVDPLEAIDALTEVIQEVGEGFSRGELFLPDLIAAGATMAKAMAELTAVLKQKGLERKSLGKVVIGTVFGDIHSIGKDMVSTLMTASGFAVHDLGIDIKAERFVEAIKQDRPDILAMSALLTTTAKEQKVVIEALKKEGLRNQVKVIVGGGAIDQSFATGIGADGYASTAPEAVILVKSLIGR
jgi:corrinoid protein of di/trimethylamine methyltransferase